MTTNNTPGLFDESTTYDMGALDIHIVEIDGRYWITTTPGFQDATTYESRDHLGADIIEAISQHERGDIR